MVFYECVVTTRNTASFAHLTKLVKTLSNKIVTSGGIVRSVQNHGTRDLPHRFKAKYADREGNRYYKNGRFFSIYYDSNPMVQKEVDGLLRMDEEVLRNTHLKARNKLWYVNIAREDKNPYIQRVLEMEKMDATAAAVKNNEKSA
mmetsp:Transcript_17706/g.25859  ORF Transcript_17706/g.25859 Transcript_17706/m.25859 type:complete len:145 (-) Transcript_17706:299-733(-)|eukprot:CAMPEP_0197245932 /NCGR_PEP_ID=MMETSP1429-20130617/10561_1 /TAXON_ID=49237 /ORGANISM="Chaetoceros  sp., Strain UNC1202" /LENGTH=144 /DNA_ID=CAMNT_0042706515 /DNA_START=99 /DNA_END=533 /DNA_ORIENTATION=+